MEKTGRMRQWGLVLWLLAMAALPFSSLSHQYPPSMTPIRRLLQESNVTNTKFASLPMVKLHTHRQSENQVVMDNGIVQVTLSTPDGDVIGLKYDGFDNLLDISQNDQRKGYWDVAWNRPGERSAQERLTGATFNVITSTEDILEVSFTRSWNISDGNYSAPINIDKRFILRRGSSGFYTYTILERPEGLPAVQMTALRIVFRLRNDKFNYMALSDESQRIMPSSYVRGQGEELDYKEAMLIYPNDPKRREVDDKYQYSAEDKDIKVHGWISFDPSVGFWMITPSHEFRVAGPIKQDLTSHVGPVSLTVFCSAHYAGGKYLGMNFEDGEPWNKVFGPVFVYLNSVSKEQDPLTLWHDAKEQMLIEADSWPYDFPQSKDFPPSDQRGMIAGQLKVRDRYISEKLISAKNAYVGLALPGDVGSWQRESKGYQFWTQTDENGYFLIKNVRPGSYNLYGWVPGFIGDYKYETPITIEPGTKMKLGSLVYEPPRHGPTLWEIGIPDRTAAEFFVPDPNPNLTNRLYNEHDRFRQYGLWRRYQELYPNKDLVYTVGVDNYTKDWFYAHVNRDHGNRNLEPTTWQIKFQLENVNTSGDYTLQLALASATYAELQVRFNNPDTKRPHFTTRYIGDDNAIARHGIHGLYWLFNINVPSYRLIEGNNTIYLTQPRHTETFQGVMYDYLRLEGPPNI